MQELMKGATEAVKEAGKKEAEDKEEKPAPQVIVES